MPADRLLLRDGLPPVEAQNRSGSVSRDRGAWSGLFGAVHAGRLLLSQPSFDRRGAWRMFEPILRERAGLGKLDQASHHVATDKKYLFCDVAVIGGGPAGSPQRDAAADAGADVLLVEAAPRLGGFALAMPGEAHLAGCVAADREPSGHHRR